MNTEDHGGSSAETKVTDEKDTNEVAGQGSENKTEAVGPEQSSEIYQVGYGRPPRSGQFKRGQSGNPKGRPKGRRKKNLNEYLADVYQESIQVSINGKQTRVPRLVAILRKQCERALEGDSRAMQSAVNNAKKLGQLEPKEQSEPPRSALFHTIDAPVRFPTREDAEKFRLANNATLEKMRAEGEITDEQYKILAYEPERWP